MGVGAAHPAARSGKLMPNENYTTAREDMAKLIAQETSGLVGAIAEQDDYELADIFIKIINGEMRHTMSHSMFRILAQDLV